MLRYPYLWAALLPCCTAANPADNRADTPATPVEATTVKTATAPTLPTQATAAPSQSAATSPADALEVSTNAVDDPAANEVFATLNGALRHCYAAAREKKPTLGVDWACFYTRDRSGRVLSVDIPGKPHQALRRCVVKAVMAAKFPAPKNPGAQDTFFVLMKTSVP